MSYFPMFWHINVFLFVLVCLSAGINKKELTFLQNLERLVSHVVSLTPDLVKDNQSLTRQLKPRTPIKRDLNLHNFD